MPEGNGDEYEGIPIRDLRIESIDGIHRADHIRVRSQRKGTTEFDVEPEWATEAARDPNRIIGTTGGRSIKVVGLSVSAPARTSGERGRLLKVWPIPKISSKASGGEHRHPRPTKAKDGSTRGERERHRREGRQGHRG